MKLIKISKEEYEELMELIPIDSSPNEWLICHNNVIALWYDFCMYNTMSKKQLNSLQLLINNGILKSPYKCYYTNEKYKINERNKFLNGEINEEQFYNFSNLEKEKINNILVLCKEIK